MPLPPDNCHSDQRYRIYYARRPDNTLRGTGVAPAMNYAKIGMEWTAVSTNPDGIHFAFASVASPLTYLSHVSAEIPNSGGQASLYQQSMGHPEPLEFLLQPAPTANRSILYFSNGSGGVLTANTPFSATVLANQPSPHKFTVLSGTLPQDGLDLSELPELQGIAGI
ncbi:hypothetical protein B0H16DRAFT_1465881 [Mycena metata]|uniref:Uncharacterized protein n=1 Tax=Mycena metata TaxID=1033252 RepID=A0AAD7I9N9_9AGAR|nr:hypothetical protein B0H16DRAFT_1465881 [Mycena metata]